ncbi:unnamed protein product [Paramecium primaurelia]|uniref:Uncharacterized protein n=1 Tax=Paramecium primaurelia TaxID=5886 RepID=A0A8S1LN33_PARPR|nr:unnamed protein product [Paramecium primaurelia]
MNSILKFRYLIKLDFTLKNLKNFIRLTRFMIYQNFQITYIQQNQDQLLLSEFIENKDFEFEKLTSKLFQEKSVCFKLSFSQFLILNLKLVQRP